MNTVGEKIDITEKIKSCRQLDPRELINLLRASGFTFMSWGATAFTVDNQHKGHVYIFVNGADLFDVYLTTLQGTIIEISDGSHGGLYFDMLSNWIDERIEKQSDYVR